jgi:hypothetical protein
MERLSKVCESGVNQSEPGENHDSNREIGHNATEIQPTTPDETIRVRRGGIAYL